MRIPFWIWIVIGLSVLSWIIPDGFPGEEFLLPAIAVGGLLIRRLMMKNFYQQQYQQYQKQSGQSGSTGASGSSGTSGSGGPFGSSGTSGSAGALLVPRPRV